MATLCNRAAILTPSPHKVAVALLNYVAEMDVDPKFNAFARRRLVVALNHCSLDFDGAVHCIDDAAEFDDAAVARALDDAVMHLDGRIDQVAAKGPKASEDSILVRTSKPSLRRAGRPTEEEALTACDGSWQEEAVQRST